jgi:hypothetical protein
MSQLSEPMERVLSVLRTHSCPSTKQIEDLANVCSARDWVRHLRDKGFNIITMPDGKSPSGARVFRYRLEETAPVARELFQQ